MNKEAFVVPRSAELIVRDPSSMQPLPAEGFTVTLTGKDGKYWRRRISCGDVSVGKPKLPKKKVKEG